MQVWNVLHVAGWNTGCRKSPKNRDVKPYSLHFQILDTCLSCDDIARQSCATVPRWRHFGDIFACCIFSEPRVARIKKLGIIAQLCRTVSSQLRHVSTIRKNLLNSNTSSTCSHNTANFGSLTAEIGLGVWDTPANFNGFRVLAALLHGTLVVGVRQTLRRWTDGATYIRQGSHHVGHWPTF